MKHIPKILEAIDDMLEKNSNNSIDTKISLLEEQRKNRQLQEILNHAKSELDSFKKICDLHEQEISNHTKEKTRKNIEISKLKDELKDLRKEYGLKLSEIQTLIEEKNDVYGRYRTLYSMYETLLIELKNKENEIQNLKSIIPEEVLARNKELLADRKKSNELIDKLVNDLEYQELNYDRLNKDHDLISKENEKLKNVLSSVNLSDELILTLKDKISQLEEDNNKLKAQLIILKTTIDKTI